MHVKSSKTHCKQGHAYTPENIHWVLNANGRRYTSCKTCRPSGRLSADEKAARIAERQGRRETRLLANYTVNETGCWIWKNSLDTWGYGHFKLRGRSYQAHRFVYERTVGLVPNGLELDHLCRTPACVNPTHLEPVTTAENARRGLNCKYTIEQIREVRKLMSLGISKQKIAREFGMSPTHVLRIARNKAWKDVP